MKYGCALYAVPWTDVLAARLARRMRWSPIGTRIAVVFDEAGDDALTGHTAYGIVRASGVAEDGTPTDLLIELDEPVHYCGHYAKPDMTWLVTRPCLRWKATSCLLFGWSAVRIVDAPSFRDATFDRTIAVGRVVRI